MYRQVRQLPHQILVTEVTELRATLDLLDELKTCIYKVYMLFSSICRCPLRENSRGIATEVFRNWSSKIDIL